MPRITDKTTIRTEAIEDIALTVSNNGQNGIIQAGIVNSAIGSDPSTLSNYCNYLSNHPEVSPTKDALHLLALELGSNDKNNALDKLRKTDFAQLIQQRPDIARLLLRDPNDLISLSLKHENTRGDSRARSYRIGAVLSAVQSMEEFHEDMAVLACRIYREFSQDPSARNELLRNLKNLGKVSIGSPAFTSMNLGILLETKLTEISQQLGMPVVIGDSATSFTLTTSQTIQLIDREKYILDPVRHAFNDLKREDTFLDKATMDKLVYEAAPANVLIGLSSIAARIFSTLSTNELQLTEQQKNIAIQFLIPYIAEQLSTTLNKNPLEEQQLLTILTSPEAFAALRKYYETEQQDRVKINELKIIFGKIFSLQLNEQLYTSKRWDDWHFLTGVLDLDFNQKSLPSKPTTPQTVIPVPQHNIDGWDDIPDTHKTSERYAKFKELRQNYDFSQAFADQYRTPYAKNLLAARYAIIAHRNRNNWWNFPIIGTIVIGITALGSRIFGQSGEKALAPPYNLPAQKDKEKDSDNQSFSQTYANNYQEPGSEKSISARYAVIEHHNKKSWWYIPIIRNIVIGSMALGSYLFGKSAGLLPPFIVAAQSTKPTTTDTTHLDQQFSRTDSSHSTTADLIGGDLKKANSPTPSHLSTGENTTVSTVAKGTSSSRVASKPINHGTHIQQAQEIINTFVLDIVYLAKWTGTETVANLPKGNLSTKARGLNAGPQQVNANGEFIIPIDYKNAYFVGSVSAGGRTIKNGKVNTGNELSRIQELFATEAFSSSPPFLDKQGDLRPNANRNNWINLLAKTIKELTITALLGGFDSTKESMKFIQSIQSYCIELSDTEKTQLIMQCALPKSFQSVQQNHGELNAAFDLRRRDDKTRTVTEVNALITKYNVFVHSALEITEAYPLPTIKAFLEHQSTYLQKTLKNLIDTDINSKDVKKLNELESFSSTTEQSSIHIYHK